PPAGGGGNPTNTGGGGGDTTLPPQSALAQFLGEPIDATTVAYVIDRGGSSGEDNRLELTKAALLRSLKSLGPTRRFQLVFWTGPGGEPAYWPKPGPKPATADNIAGVQSFLDEEIYPHLATDPSAALRRALKAHPG